VNDDPDDQDPDNDPEEDEDIALLFSVPGPASDELQIRAEALRIAVESFEADTPANKDAALDQTVLIHNRAENFVTFLKETPGPEKLTLEKAIMIVLSHPEHGHAFPFGDGMQLTIPAIGVAGQKMNPADIDQLVKNAFAGLNVSAEEPEYPHDGDVASLTEDVASLAEDIQRLTEDERNATERLNTKFGPFDGIAPHDEKPPHVHVNVTEGPFEGPDGVARSAPIKEEDAWHKDGWNSAIRRAQELILDAEYNGGSWAGTKTNLLNALQELLEN
jgi:hypothetical protein